VAAPGYLAFDQPCPAVVPAFRQALYMLGAAQVADWYSRPGAKLLSMWAYRLVKMLIAGSGLLLVIAFLLEDRLPAPGRLHAGLLEEPLQGPTREKPFDATVKGVSYRIAPRYTYDLTGLVVSLHDSQVWWDYAHREWNDNLNIADFCVVWGENIRRDAYRSVSYSHTQWECWWSGSGAAAQAFDGTAMSNNHMITDDPDIARRMRQVRIGDEVRFRGYLVDYTTFKDGAPAGTRKTSIVRTDEGEGACEVVWVQELEIIRATKRGWRILLRVAGALLLLGILAWARLPPRLAD
jgi:hypothetical protein